MTEHTEEKALTELTQPQTVAEKVNMSVIDEKTEPKTEIHEEINTRNTTVPTDSQPSAENQKETNEKKTDISIKADVHSVVPQENRTETIPPTKQDGKQDNQIEQNQQENVPIRITSDKTETEEFFDIYALLVQPEIPLFRPENQPDRPQKKYEDFSTLSFLKLKAPDFVVTYEPVSTDGLIDISALSETEAKVKSESVSPQTVRKVKASTAENRKTTQKTSVRKKKKKSFADNIRQYWYDIRKFIKGLFGKDKKKKLSQKKYSQKWKKMYPKMAGGIIACAVALIVAFVCMYNFNQTVIPVVSSVNIPGGQIPKVQEEPVFLKGIQVEGFDLSGKTLEEAKSLLYVRGASLLPQVSFSVIYEGLEYRYSNDDMIFSHNMNDVVERAYEYSNYVIAEGSKDIMAYVPDDGNIEINKEQNTLNFRVEYKVTAESVRKIIRRVAKKVDIPCIEPHVSRYDPFEPLNSERYTFAEGKEGKVINQETLFNQAMEQFNHGVSNVVVTATSYQKQPQLKMADVRQATKLIGKYKTITNNTYNANVNMELALEAVNGTILEPNEIFSFNKCTGDSNLATNGYLPAGVIAQGEMTTGIGGGICQSATTIYNAGIMANMEIVERRPHLWCSLYCYGGLDATIDWGNIDLKMKNNSLYQMFFRCWMDGNELNVEIYGWQSPEFDEVRTESKVDWSSDEAYGYNAYRVFYKDGRQVKKEELPYSVYSIDGSGIREGDYGDVSTKLVQPE